ncbi:hypothetical protein ACFQZZ_16485 [Nocardia sp. GCM10030253]|uniref:hypothetical protein n=1 Tax=Nocardia sp. GCM10030253 TaxID=3273404 RepID=UPI00363145DA
MSRRILLVSLFAIASSLGSNDADAALYWQLGVRDSTVSVCFVGDATTARPDRVQQILDNLREFEYAANVRFDSWGRCPAATRSPDGNDFHDGDIRVVIPGTSVSGTGQVPGQGCPATTGNINWGSWANPPSDLEMNRHCVYNLKLGDDPWPPPGWAGPSSTWTPQTGNPPSSTPYLNHTLHEFGHALGLSHEHERSDATPSTCTVPGYGGGVVDGFMTPYDNRSIMNYSFTNCGVITGNYSNSGLSEWDKLAVHILYPEDPHIAEYTGTTVVHPSDVLLILRSAWQMRGANIDYVAKDFSWKLFGTEVSRGPVLNIDISLWRNYFAVRGIIPLASTSVTFPFEFSYVDFLGRHYSHSGVIRLLSDQDFNRQIAAPVSALLPLRQ